MQEDLIKKYSEFDELIGKIGIAEQEIRSATFFFDEAKESLKEGIIKRLESKNNRVLNASQLSRRALNKTEDALSSLESSTSKKMGQWGDGKL